MNKSSSKRKFLKDSYVIPQLPCPCSLADINEYLVELHFELNKSSMDSPLLDVNSDLFNGNAQLKLSVLSFIESMLNSPFSPWAPELSIIPIDDAYEHDLCETANYLLRTILVELKLCKRRRVKSATYANLPTLTTSTALSDAFKHIQARNTAFAKSKANQRIVTKAVPSLIELSEKKRAERFNLERKRINREIAAGVERIWSVCSELAARATQNNVRIIKQKLLEKEQRNWTKRAELYVEALWKKINLRKINQSDLQAEESMNEDDDASDVDINDLKAEAKISIQELRNLTEKSAAEAEEARKVDEAAKKYQNRRQRRLKRLDEINKQSKLNTDETLDNGIINEINSIEAIKPTTSFDSSVSITKDFKLSDTSPNESASDDDNDEKYGITTLTSYLHCSTNELQEITKNKVSSLLHVTLRAYQLEGVEWMATLHDNNFSGILADEMGLGKTVQTIAFLSYLASCKGIWGPHIIIVPSSVLYNWENEFLKCAPALRVLVYDGSKKVREAKRKGMFTKLAYNVILTSYKLAVLDASVLRRMSYYYMILDEAHLIKNFNGTRWKTIHEYSTCLKLLLTGTPLQNDLIELWALMYMVVPQVFGKHEEFDQLFNSPLIKSIETQQCSTHVTAMIQKLYKIIRPFMLRRLKRTVEKQLPKQTEHVIKCSLTYKQLALYNDLIYAYDKEIQQLSKEPTTLSNMQFLMNLRKVTNHPSLVEEISHVSPMSTDFLNVHVKLHRMFDFSKTERFTLFDRRLVFKPDIVQVPLLYLTPSTRFNLSISQFTSLFNEASNVKLNEFASKLTPCATQVYGQFWGIKDVKSFVTNSNYFNLIEKNDEFDVFCNSITRSQKSLVLPKVLQSIAENPSIMNLHNYELQLFKNAKLKTRQKLTTEHFIKSKIQHIDSLSHETVSFIEKEFSYEFTDNIVSSAILDSCVYRPYLTTYTKNFFIKLVNDIKITKQQVTFGDPCCDKFNLCQNANNTRKVSIIPCPVFTQGANKNDQALNLGLSDLSGAILSNDLNNKAFMMTSSPNKQLNKGSSLCSSENSSLLRSERHSSSYMSRESKLTCTANNNLKLDSYNNFSTTSTPSATRKAEHNNDNQSLSQNDSLERSDFYDQNNESVKLNTKETYEDLQNQLSATSHMNTITHDHSIHDEAFDFFNNPLFAPTKVDLTDKIFYSYFSNDKNSVYSINLLLYYPQDENIQPIELQERLILETAVARYRKVPNPILHVPNPYYINNMASEKYNAAAKTINELHNSQALQLTNVPFSSNERLSCLSALSVIVRNPKDFQYDSGKLFQLKRVLEQADQQKRKVIVFVQMTKMLDLLEAFLSLYGYKYLRLDGSTKVSKRQEIVDQFNADSSIRIIITSTRTGGVGINLTVASIIVFYDTDWNPALDKQAMNRCHRIGQTHDVDIYRLITCHTIEENIWRKQIERRKLSDLIVDKGNFSRDYYSSIFTNDAAEILFTINKEEDLYVSRVLHDTEEDYTTVDHVGKDSNLTALLSSIEDEQDRNKSSNKVPIDDMQDFVQLFSNNTSNIEDNDVTSLVPNYKDDKNKSTDSDDENSIEDECELQLDCNNNDFSILQGLHTIKPVDQLNEATGYDYYESKTNTDKQSTKNSGIFSSNRTLISKTFKINDTTSISISELFSDNTQFLTTENITRPIASAYKQLQADN